MFRSRSEREDAATAELTSNCIAQLVYRFLRFLRLR